ncbi:DUF1540 domain-containing protein [Fodinisporobacter ferrooxydans]|uniref:DUF1540 domain-containing protein n=1 Tax=Fodinisporobacter ferrooxydans TaxID=2901836 RepID=A0ABY4CH98_9BACL|nr:DUF1540 domain-containing protein [Alicyclobacillaceae bacterium MYW30-H2]
MPQGVRCTVEECSYNDNKNCIANSIEVRSNGNDIVGTKKGTLCATFEYRDFDDAGIAYGAGADKGSHPTHPGH